MEGLETPWGDIDGRRLVIPPTGDALPDPPAADVEVLPETGDTFARWRARTGHDAVLEAAVFGEPDPQWGERVCAAISFKADPVDEAELDAHCRAHLAGFKVPRRYVFLEQLPRTGSGKINKRALRAAAPGE